MTTTARAGIVHDIPESDYHDDLHTLSSTGARTLATRTPAEFRHEQVSGRPPKREYDFGHLVHKMILGAGADIVTVDADSWRTNAAKAKRDEAYEAGEVPVLEKDWRRAERVVDSFRLHPTAAELVTGGSPEVSMYWTDEFTGVACRGRVDYLRPDVAVDLKTTQDSTPEKFAQSVADYGYHQQADWYLRGLHECGWTGQDFLFVTVSVVAPYLASVCRLDPTALAIGQDLNDIALHQYAECAITGTWPGHGDGIHTIGLPRWVVKQWEES